MPDQPEDNDELLITKPIAATVRDGSTTVVIMEDGSVWESSAGSEWREEMPIPGTWRWNSWPKGRGARAKLPSASDEG